MRLLITGGAGFIGSYLAEAYLARGEEIYVIDDLSTGSIENIEPLLKTPQFHFVNDTILNRDIMLELIGICDVAVVADQAAVPEAEAQDLALLRLQLEALEAAPIVQVLQDVDAMKVFLRNLLASSRTISVPTILV